MGTVFAGGDAIAVWPLYSIFSKRERERELWASEKAKRGWWVCFRLHSIKAILYIEGNPRVRGLYGVSKISSG